MKLVKTARVVLALPLLIALQCARAQEPAVYPPYYAPPSYSPAEATGAPSTDQAPASSRWPMHIPTSDGEIVIFQPQLEDFQGDTLKGRAAVSVTSSRQQEPMYGAVWLESRVATDRAARTVQILQVNVTRTHFPNADQATSDSIASAIRDALNARPATLSLDQLLAMLETVQKQQQFAADLQNAPPRIVFKDHPTVKIQYDGAPKLEQVPNSNLLRVVNTPFFVCLEGPTKTYFLKGAGRWFSAPEALGPFHEVNQVPSAVTQLADASGYKDPQQPLSDAQASRLEIVTATEPTELIWTDGEPQMASVPNTDLLYVTNTDADLFMTIENQQLWVLLSGRWYTAPNRSGPWAFVAPDQLPADFARIPPGSDKGDVLAHVSGTQAARDAVADTEIPQTATVDRANYEQPPVEYDGEPQFQPVPDAECSYAVNTPQSVVLVRDRYYCCYNAVWYTCPQPRGRWEICTVVPTEVYRLPPSCPIYSVRFCYIYGYTPAVVYAGYTPGYVGCYTYRNVVVYGTGYHYTPWYRTVYYPRPYTFGFAAHYNSYVDHWGFSFALAGGGASTWIGHEPDRWVRHDPWFGYGGYRPVIVHNDVRVNVFRREYIERVAPHPNDRPERHDVYQRNVYDRRNDVHWESPRPAEHVVTNRPAPTARPAPTPKPVAREDHHNPAPPATTPPRQETPRRTDLYNNVFTDRNGDIYRKTVDGWESRDPQGRWQPRTVNQHPTEQHPVPIAAQPKPEPRQEPRPEAHQAAPPHPTAPSVARPSNERPEEHPATPPAAHEHATATPSPHAEEHASPKPAEPKSDVRELNRDYRARVVGEDRLRNYEHDPAAPHAAPRPEAPPTHEAPPPRQPAPSPPPPRREGHSDTGNHGNAANDNQNKNRH